ncbi:tyrosine-type recombinase/integrase [Variovorax sp. VNK109]|uniref:tyrosine-type recombinase/integrase n=1 Tax=Variovorax sp. VNK109 TaxID=3400919 RepID=UPI003C065A04
MNFVGGVSGLGLYVSGCGSRSWIFRARVAGKRRDMGLGGFPDVTLAQAREMARDARAKLRIGIDPIEERRSARSALIAARATAVTFSRAAGLYIEAQEATWRNPKHRQQWANTLTTYAGPHIGGMLVRDIEVGHVMAALEPIWAVRTETASRLRGRIESVLDWATVRGFRAGPNPARWKGHLDKLLPAPGKLKKVDHHRSLPYAEAQAFMDRLRVQEGMGARALELVVLTAARSGEVRGATWNEFDLDQAVWVVPAERMKAKREHRVPLSAQAVALLRRMEEVRMTAYVFPGSRKEMISDMTISAALRRMGLDAVPHGFRSTFRDWAAEQTEFPREVAEMALAHTVGTAVERAYLRTDLFDRRRQLMQAWADYVCPQAKE